ncbi:unnamed protein product, partial [Polarella glacialis]
EFLLESSLVGRLIGKGGSNLQAIETAHGVRLSLRNSPDEGYTTVSISGDDRAAVEKVRELTEVVKETMAVEPPMIGWARGRDGSSLRGIKSTAGLQDCLVD